MFLLSGCLDFIQVLFSTAKKEPKNAAIKKYTYKTVVQILG